MDCPKCGYAMTDFDAECPRCKRLGQQAVRQQPAAQQEEPQDQEPSEADRPRQEASGEQVSEQPPVPQQRAGEQDQTEKLRQYLLYLAAPTILIIIGSVTPWIGLRMGVLDFTVSGTDVGDWRWGIWTLLLGIGSLWLVTNAYFTEREILFRLLAGAAAACVLILSGIFAYFIWIVSLKGFAWGWYVAFFGAVGLLAAVVALKYKPQRQEIMTASTVFVLVVAVCAVAGSASDARKARLQAEQAMAQLEEIGLAIPPLAPGLAPSTPPAAVPQRARKNISVVMGRYWETQELGSGLMIHSADPGKKLLVITVTVTNNESEELRVSDEDFELVASDKNVYNAGSMIYDRRVNRLSARVLPGGNATGDIIFEVASRAQPVQVRYAPMWPW